MTNKEILNILNDKYKKSYIMFTVDNKDLLYANGILLEESWSQAICPNVVYGEQALIALEDIILADFFQKVDEQVRKLFIIKD